jgi:broad specificity phosphatase PhoE
MTTLFLLRHGPTTASDTGAPLGHLDLPVSEWGRAQWPRVKAELLELGIERVFSSDLRRAEEHAQSLELPHEVLPCLREQDFGEWDGRPWSEIEETEGFFADPVNRAPPGGESFAQCAERAIRVTEKIPAEGPSTLLLLAHAGPLRAILARHLGLPLERALALGWEPFGLTRLDLYGADRAVLQFHNRPLG